MTMSRVGMAVWGGVAIMLSGVCTVAPAATPRDLHHKRPVRAVALAPSIGSFTPAGADPRFAASFGRGGLGASSGFRFTPSSTPGNSRRVTVAVRARAATTGEAERVALGAINPYAYNLGVAVGWKRFAITSDYAKVDLGPIPGSTESADVALSFAGHRWSTRVALAADRALGDVPRTLGPDRNVSVDLGGSYSINNRLDLTGGVRYRMDRLDQIADDRRDSQAVYVGTAFRF
jgi:hypothetical protein